VLNCNVRNHAVRARVKDSLHWVNPDRRNQYDKAYQRETGEPFQGRIRVSETRRYPIEDAAHARDALARSSGKPEHAAVVTAVRRKYPEIDIEK